MDAKQKQGMAALEEFLQEQYIDSFEKVDQNGVEYTPLEVLLKTHSEYFYQDGSKDYIVKQITYSNESGESQTDFLKIRLIRKVKIPNEIQESLVGGEAIGRDGNRDSYDAYDQLLDVYGVTNDLKVFYCSNGLESSQGANYFLSESYDSGKVLYNSDSSLSKAISETYGEPAKNLTLKDLLSITELTIAPSSNISDLNSLADLQNLEKLTLVDFFGTLEGIERAYNLTYIYFDNSQNVQNINFTGFEGATSLNEIRFYNPTDVELKKMCDQMSRTDYNFLDKIYLFGDWNSEWANWNGTYRDLYGEANLESINYLDSLSVGTKDNVKKIMVSCTKVSSLRGLEGYEQLTHLRLYKNHLENINELSSLRMLNYLDLSGNEELNSINGISNISTLSTILMRFVPNLIDVSPVVLSSNPDYLDGLSNTNFDFSTEVWAKDENALISKLGEVRTLLLDSKYGLIFVDGGSISLSSDFNWEQIRVLKNKKTLKTINFNGNKNLTNSELQELLTSLSNIKNINLDSTNIETLDFVTDGELSLNRISFYETKVTDIIPLYGQSDLGYVRFSVYKDNGSITHKVKLHDQDDEKFNEKIISIIETSYDKSQKEIGNYFPNGGGFVPGDSIYWPELNKLTNLTKFSMRWYTCPSTYNFDFSGTRLRSINLGMGNGASVKVPNTIENINVTYKLNFQASSIDNLKSLSGNGSVVINCEDVNTIFNSIQNGVKVSHSGDVVGNIEDIIGYYDFDLVGSFSHTHVGVNGNLGTFSSSMVSPMIRCNYFCIGCENVSRLDGNDFSEFTRDFTFILNKCGVTTFDNVNLATKLKVLQLTNNRISDVSFFVDGYENSNLQKLYLTNNKLENLTTYKNKDGTSVTMKTSEVIGRLPNLTYVDLSENNNLTDFSGLIKNGFSETGNNTKIFTKK